MQRRSAGLGVDVRVVGTAAAARVGRRGRGSRGRGALGARREVAPALRVLAGLARVEVVGAVDALLDRARAIGALAVALVLGRGRGRRRAGVREHRGRAHDRVTVAVVHGADLERDAGVERDRAHAAVRDVAVRVAQPDAVVAAARARPQERVERPSRRELARLLLDPESPVQQIECGAERAHDEPPGSPCG